MSKRQWILLLVIAIVVSCIQPFQASTVLTPLDGVVQVAAGGDFSIALRDDGTVWTWGNNDYAQLGRGNIPTPDAVAGKVATLDSVIAIAAGLSHGVAVKSDGTVWVWGFAGVDGNYGIIPVRMTGAVLSNIVAVSAGANHTVALRGDGTVWAWGKNNYGQLGNTYTNDSWIVPVQVKSIANVVAITSGQNHNLALCSDGSVWSWGHNAYGQLGDGTTTNTSTVFKLNLSSVTAIGTGLWHSFAVTSEGALYGWGRNSGKQLDLSSDATKKQPILLDNSLYSLSISGGADFSVLKSSTGLWSWGTNDYKQLGIDTDGAAPPTLTNINATQVACGSYHSVGISPEKIACAWGRNNYGQLGRGTGATTSWEALPVLYWGESPPVIATGLVLSPLQVTLDVSDSVTLQVSAEPETAELPSLLWQSDDEDIVTVNENGLVTGVAPGTVTITVQSSDGVLSATCEVTVRAIHVEPLTIAADSKSKTYGEADPELTYQIVSGELAGGDTLIGSLSRTVGESAGHYETLQGTLTAGEKYNITFIPGVLAINAAPLLIQADQINKSYGEVDPELSVSYAGFKFADTEAVISGLSVDRETGEALGTYIITPTSATADNYDISYATGAFTISKAALTITADPQSKVYGTADPALSYQVTSGTLVSGEEITGSLTRAVGEDCDIYEINQGTLLADNYEIEFAPAQLTVTAAPLTITADAQSKVYGQADPALTHKVTSGSLVSGDLITGGLTRITGETVGSYELHQGNLTAGSNYDLTYIPADLTITAAPLSITADAQSKVYGQDDPAFTYQVTSGQLASGDPITGALARVAGESIGTYEIQLGTVTAGDNYAITYVPDNLIIHQALLIISADSKTKTYGQADPELTYKLTSGTLIDGDSITGAITRTAGEDVGTYEIQQGALTAGNNYTLAYVPAILSISKAPLEVTANPTTKVYGQDDPTFTHQVTSGSLVSGDSVTGALIRIIGENVGTYEIQQGTLTAGSNYDLTYIPAALIVDAAPLTITADAKAKEYGQIDPALTHKVTSGSLVDGDSIIGALARAAGEDVGSYEIQQGTLTAASNYVITYVPADLTITAAPLAIMADAKSKPVGSADPTLTYQVTGLVAGDTRASTLTGALARVPGERVGTYQILIGTLSAGTNYDLAYTPADLLIRYSPSEPVPTPISPPPIEPNKELFISEEGEFAVLVGEPSIETAQDGAVTTTYVIPDEVVDDIALAKIKGATTIVISLGESTAGFTNSHTSVLIPATILAAIAEGETAAVTISTPAASLTLHPALVSALAAQGKDLSISIHRPAAATLNEDIPTGSTVMGDPLSVQTGIKGTTLVTMPMHLLLPTDAQEREDLLAALTIFAMHSDATTQNIYDVVTEVDEVTGQHILTSVSFVVDKFSTFTLITLTKEPLNTVVGVRSYTIAGITKDMVACYYKGADTMMPIRMLEHFGVNLDWDEATTTATMSYKQNIVQLTIGCPDAYINGVKTPIVGASGNLVPPELALGRTMIPLRFVSEKLGFKVTWDPSNLITISP